MNAEQTVLLVGGTGRTGRRGRARVVARSELNHGIPQDVIVERALPSAALISPSDSRT
jgi:hypothetical protein